MMGRVENLWVKRFAGGPMDPVEHLELVATQGIIGNADQGGWRQVTVISRERWNQAEADLGAAIDPELRRANMLVTGLDLADTRGQVLEIGDVRLEIRGETRPCRLMDEQHDGLKDALDAEWGGGAFAYVHTGGTIHVGDEIRLVAPSTD
ncbi:MAG: MOSC domain-containing protein YiiM [Glaciecola sp.]|jgi:MOSC domain-containing protein YiiM